MILKEPIEKLINHPFKFTKGLNFPDPKEIRIYDTTLRDGDQMPGVAFSPEQKYELAKRLNDLGIHILDMGFPGVSKSERKALQLIMQAKRRGEIREDLEILVMCRCNINDIDITINTLKDIGVHPNEVTFFLFTSGSDLHMKYKIGKTLLKREGRREEEWLDLPVEFYREATKKMSIEAISYAREQGIEHIEFGGEDGSRADIDYLIEHTKACFEAGGTRYGFPDTVGVLTPQSVNYYIPKLIQALPDKEMVIHFHNDFGFAGINTITAMSHGIKIACCTANGIGERAGNAPLHQVVVALRELYGVEIPNFKYHKLTELRRLIEEFSGIPVSVHEPIIGEGVFSHESGIHIAGILVEKSIYQVIPPELVGGVMRFIFGRHSGTSAIEAVLMKNKKRLEEEGIELTSSFVNRITQFVKEVREQKSESGELADAVRAYYTAYRNLGISEEHLVEIAIALGHVIDSGD